MQNVPSVGREFAGPPLIALVRLLVDRAPRGLIRFLVVGLGGLVAWTPNRRYAFGDSGRHAKVELSRYASVALLAQGVNYLVFLGVCAVAIRVPHMPAAVIGALAAIGFSYNGQRFFTLARVRTGSN